MDRITETEINEFVARIQKLMDSTVNCESANTARKRVRVRKFNDRQKYIAIDSYDDWSTHEQSCGVFCFVAAQDNNSKAVGPVIKGDVLKAASYNAPARHPRGNILSCTGGMAGMTWTGPAYL